MVDERNRPGWWQTAPGVMTSTAAVIAAVTGLLGGLTQLGVLDRWTRPPVPNPAAAASAPGQDTAAVPAAPRSEPAPAEPASSARSAPRPAAPSPADSTPTAPVPTPAGQLPSGTTLELAAASRTCSTTSRPGDRVVARVMVRVTGTGGAVVPVGTSATLAVTRLDAPAYLGVRAGSLSLRGRSYPLRNAQAKVHRRESTAGAGQTGAGAGACIPAGGRITVTLRSPLTFGRGS